MQKNRDYGRSSDIFHTKNINKPEYNQPPSKPRLGNNHSSSDLLAWKRQSSQTESKPIRVHRSPHKMGVEPNHKLCFASSTAGKRTESKVVFGTDDNKDSVVRKKNTTAYDPTIYYRKSERSAYDRKFRELSCSDFGDKTKLRKNLKDELNSKPTMERQRSSSTFGTMNREFGEDKPNFQIGPKISNKQEGPKRNFYKNEILKQNSSGYFFDKNKQSKTLKIDGLKSNIFNDPDKETINKIDNTKYAGPAKNNEKKLKPRPKTNRITEDRDNYIIDLDWRDTRTNLFFKSPETKEMKKPIERKMEDLYGKGAAYDTNRLKGPQKEEDKSMRDALTKKLAYETPKSGIDKIQKKIENVAYYQNKNPYKNKNYEEEQKQITPQSEEKTYELKNFTNSNDVNLTEIEKAFRKKGLHIYGIKNETGVGDYGKKGRITFNVRNNDNKGVRFKRKMNGIKKEIKEKNGYDIENYTKNKKPV